MLHFIPPEPELAHVGGNTIGGNPATFYPYLWAWLVKTLNVKTVLDVGCGEGHAMSELKRLGCTVFGIDGHPRNALLAAADVHDLTKGPYIAPVPIDLVWSCEVVQQIEERYVDNVLATLAQGRYIAMTNGLPGQPGYHMVNNQPIKYWQTRLEKRGFTVEHELIQATMQQFLGHHYWTSTGMIYRRTM